MYGCFSLVLQVNKPDGPVKLPISRETNSIVIVLTFTDEAVPEATLTISNFKVTECKHTTTTTGSQGTTTTGTTAPPVTTGPTSSGMVILICSRNCNGL